MSRSDWTAIAVGALVGACVSSCAWFRSERPVLEPVTIAMCQLLAEEWYPAAAPLCATAADQAWDLIMTARRMKLAAAQGTHDAGRD